MIAANAAGTTQKPWRFSGRANVRATLEILKQRFGLDDARYSMKGAATPTLQTLLDAFVSKADPDPFSFIDFTPLPE